MVDDAQRQELGTPPPVVEIVPELADASLMAICDLRPTCRKEIDALVRLYDKRYEKRRDDFLNGRRGNKPLSKNEVTRFHRQWRDYVRGVVEPLFARAQRTARMRDFVREQMEALGCKLVGSAQARKIVPFLNLKILGQKGRLRTVQFEKTEYFYSEEDLKRIATADADVIEKKRQKYEAEERQRARFREEECMKMRLRRDLFHYGVDRDLMNRLTEEAAGFKSVRDLFDTDYFTRSWDLVLPDDCSEYIRNEILAAERAKANGPVRQSDSGEVDVIKHNDALQ